MTTLVVCEKANAARRIAHFLSGGRVETKRYGRVQVHRFVRDGEEYVVLGLRGHVVSFDYPREYNSWKKTDLRELIFVEPEKFVTERDIVRVLKSVRPSKVIVATDFDREGELIGVEALELLGWKPDRALRARFSALTREEILGAFSRLQSVDTNLAYAAMARQIIDLVWGAVLTRFVSIAAGKMGKDFFSVGRVQSPTLAIVVRREREIKEFVPRPYWEITAYLHKESEESPGGGRAGAVDRTAPGGMERFSASHVDNPFWEELKATQARERAARAREGVVMGVEKREVRVYPPPPFNTTMFLGEATRLGLSASRAMQIAEDLYTNGWISYPRTDNTVYPKSLNLRGVLKELSRGEFKKEAETLLSAKRLVPTRGKTETTDHPPIYPVRGATRKDLSGYHWRIYELVVRRFFATLAPPAVVENTEARIDIGGEVFVARGKRFLGKGWTAYYPYHTIKEVFIPRLREGDVVVVDRITKRKKETKPPPRYNQGSLIKEMERLNLGTKSTRHEIIQKLFDRGYLRRPMIPTQKGVALVDVLEKHAREITEPDMTARLEEEMDAITRGEKKMEEVVEDSRRMLSKVLDALEKERESVGASLRESTMEKLVVGKCPVCGGDLVVMKPGKKRFVGCSNYPSCKQTYPLPQNGRVVPTEKTCPVCGAPIVKILTRGRSPWEICLNMECSYNKREKRAGEKKRTEGSGDR